MRSKHLWSLSQITIRQWLKRFFGEIISRDSFSRVSFKRFFGEFLSRDSSERLVGEILFRNSFQRFFERSFQEILPRAFWEIHLRYFVVREISFVLAYEIKMPLNPSCTYYKCCYCWAWRQIHGEFLSDDVWTFNEEQKNNPETSFWSKGNYI